MRLVAYLFTSASCSGMHLSDYEAGMSQAISALARHTLLLPVCVALVAVLAVAWLTKKSEEGAVPFKWRRPVEAECVPFCNLMDHTGPDADTSLLRSILPCGFVMSHRCRALCYLHYVVQHGRAKPSQSHICTITMQQQLLHMTHPVELSSQLSHHCLLLPLTLRYSLQPTRQKVGAALLSFKGVKFYAVSRNGSSITRNRYRRCA